MPKYAITYNRTTPVTKGGQVWYRRTRKGEHVINAECPLDAVKAAFSRERSLRHGAKLKLLKVHQASVDGWQLIYERG
jgi:hypothetical protein